MRRTARPAGASSRTSYPMSRRTRGERRIRAASTPAMTLTDIRASPRLVPHCAAPSTPQGACRLACWRSPARPKLCSRARLAAMRAWRSRSRPTRCRGSRPDLPRCQMGVQLRFQRYHRGMGDDRAGRVGYVQGGGRFVQPGIPEQPRRPGRGHLERARGAVLRQHSAGAHDLSAQQHRAGHRGRQRANPARDTGGCRHRADGMGPRRRGCDEVGSSEQDRHPKLRPKRYCALSRASRPLTVVPISCARNLSNRDRRHERR
jgi:hypothetical protein